MDATQNMHEVLLFRDGRYYYCDTLFSAKRCVIKSDFDICTIKTINVWWHVLMNTHSLQSNNYLSKVLP